MGQRFPTVRWRKNGEPDPHAKCTNQSRAEPPLGNLTDDERANAVSEKGMSEHTPEPWATEYRVRPDGMYAQEVFDTNGETIATLAWHAIKLPTGTGTDREENASRIVACVNFCVGNDTGGMETAVKIGETFEVMRDRWITKEIALTVQCDELLSLAERLVQWDLDYPVNCHNGYAGLQALNEIIRDSKTAITNARPE